MQSKKIEKKRNSYGGSSDFKMLENLIMQDKTRVLILRTIRKFRQHQLWIGGSFIRNLVWDFLHNYTVKTEFGDIDVFYYDKSNITKPKDQEIEKYLKSKMPNINWSVKNQARMHLHNNEAQYLSLKDAITKFPETVSSIIIRLDNKGKVQIYAPFGLSSLFNMTIEPTPHYLQENKYDIYKNRVLNKNWSQVWTEVTEKSEKQ